ncbi:MAG: hypothetical protein AB1306_03690 [Nitrospirota bacterium]
MKIIKYKLMLWFVPLLVISLVISISERCYANDAPIRLIGGGAMPSSGFNQTIKMETEEITIRLEKKSYTVDATFHFLNTGETKEEMVGFPKRGFGYWGDFKGTRPFLRFETWVNGKKTQFSEEPESASVEGVLYLPDLINAIKENTSDSLFVKDFRWLVKRVLFPSRKKTVTRVRYEAEYQESSNCLSASYIYGTGNPWKDTIGRALFKVDTAAAPEKSISVRFPVKAKYLVQEKQVSENIREYQINNFDPEADDDVFIFVGLCP